MQFLLDGRENKNIRGASCTKQADHSELKLPSKETKTTEENVSGSLTVRQQIGAEKVWVSCSLFSFS
jgi:hypothetical protein